VRYWIAVGAAAALADCRDPVQLAQRPATPLAADVAASEASYEIIDLGTLGGNLGHALAINARGQVVGWSETASRIRHAFLWEDGVMQDLGTLAGGFSSASAINNRGDIAGFSTDAAGSARTVLWTGGVLQDLGAGGGPVLSETGLVAWTAWTPTGAHPQLWDHGQVVDLGTLGGAYASATGINSRGQVVGWSDVPTASGAPHPFLWENGVMRDLGTFGGVFAVAAGINDRGQVTGSSTDANVNSHAFLWDGEMVALGTLGADRVSTGQLINERGEVAGLSIRCNSCDARHPFLWDRGVMQPAGGPDYRLTSFDDRVAAMNEMGQVVGWREQGSPRHAFLWDGATRDLGTLGGPDEHSGALAINNRGDIVGWSFVPTGEHPVLWRRTPASPSPAVVTSGP